MKRRGGTKGLSRGGGVKRRGHIEAESSGWGGRRGCEKARVDGGGSSFTDLPIKAGKLLRELGCLPRFTENVTDFG